MKKIILATAALGLAGSALADGVANLTTGGETPIDNTTNCTLLAEAVKVKLSATNIGSYDCNATTASIGLAVANPNGKFKVYSLGSAGGAITETTTSAAPTTTETQAQATAKGASS